MRLCLVPLQLSLFAYIMGTDAPPEIVDGRNGNQWLKSVLAYLAFRAGDGWRRMDSPSERRAPQRSEYLAAIRLINDVRTAPARVRQALPPPAIVVSEPQEPRSVYVDRLMALRPELTNRKILSGFSKAKLIRMIGEAEIQRPLGLERAG